MRNRCRLLGFAAAFFLAGVAPAQISDTTAPKLVDFQISPTKVDVSTNDQVITVTARITDDLSGFGLMRSSAVANFRLADDATAPVLSARFLPGLSGNQQEGIYSALLFIPAHSRTGTWSAINFTVVDEVGNPAALTTEDLRIAGFPIHFTVSGVEDRTPPELVSLSLEPTAIDTSATNQMITIIAHVTEEISWAGGYDQLGQPIPAPGTIGFESPSRKQFASARIFGEQISGDDHDGTFRTMINLPRFSEPGVWRLSSLRLNDHAGNVRNIDLAAALAKGLPAEFAVTGNGDTSPPTLRAFDILQRRIGAPTTNQSVTLVARYADDFGIFGYFDEVGFAVPSVSFVEFRSPSQFQRVSTLFFPDAGEEPRTVSSTNTLEFPRYCETGVWTLSSLTLQDGLRNTTRLDATAVRRLGFPTEIAVGIAPPITIARQENLILLSWPQWGSAFHLETRDVDAVAAWTAINAKPTAMGDQLVVAVPAVSTSQFFRLTE